MNASKISISQPIDGVKKVILHVAYNSDRLLMHIKLSDKICFFSNPENYKNWEHFYSKARIESYLSLFKYVQVLETNIFLFLTKSEYIKNSSKVFIG